MNFLRGPVLHTPQGWVLLGASVGYVLLGCVLLVDESIAALAVIRDLWVGCFFMPLILLLFFVRTNEPDFSPSMPNTAWGFVLAVIPIFLVWLER